MVDYIRNHPDLHHFEKYEVSSDDKEKILNILDTPYKFKDGILYFYYNSFGNYTLCLFEGYSFNGRSNIYRATCSIENRITFRCLEDVFEAEDSIRNKLGLPKFFLDSVFSRVKTVYKMKKYNELQQEGLVFNETD